MRRGILVLALAAAMGMARAGRAQEVNLATLGEGPSNHVTLRTGAEYGFVAGLGYGRSVRILGRQALLGAELTAPWARPDASDYRGRLHALLRVGSLGGWSLALGLAPTVRATRNVLGQMTSVGADAAAQGGYYARSWFVAGEVGFDWAASTHLTHDELYRSRVYAEARDGWYANPGGNLRYGLQVGGTIGAVDLALRIGQVRDVEGQAPLLPFYGTLAAGTRF